MPTGPSPLLGNGPRSLEEIMYRFTSKITTNPINQSGLIAGAIGGESVVLVVLVNTLIIRAFTQENLLPGDPKVIAGTPFTRFLL